MPGYIYRDELLDHLKPLLQLLGVKPEALVTLRINPRGIEIDYRNLPPDPFAPLEFSFYNIADREHVPAPVSATSSRQVEGSSPAGGDDA